MPEVRVELTRGRPHRILSPLVGVVAQRSHSSRGRLNSSNTPINSRVSTPLRACISPSRIGRSTPKYGWMRLSTGTVRGQGLLLRSAPFPSVRSYPSPLGCPTRHGGKELCHGAGQNREVTTNWRTMKTVKRTKAERHKP